MRVFKPLQLSLQHRTFGWESKNRLAVSLLLGFPFDENQETLLENELWQFLSDQLGKDAILDICVPKPHGEVLVYGSYHAPGGNPVSADEVQLKIGTVNKSLAVIGNRYWRTLLAPTDPEPFAEMPISYEYAFGGKNYKANPIGKGMDEVDVFGEMRLPMPNIEDPDNLVTSTIHRPPPAGVGPLDMTWEQRASKTGTYDETWRQDYFPGYPPDLDWAHFNAAPQNQWIEGFWRGDETFQVSNMHPEKPRIVGKLPGFRMRCFIEKQIEEGGLFSEIEMRAETVCLFPAVETGILIYRGTIDVGQDDASDVENLLVAYENSDQLPRSREYYEEALRNRLDDSKTFKFMMYTGDIVADSERCGYARMLDEVDQGGESQLDKNLQALADAEMQKAMDMLQQQKKQLGKRLEAAGIDSTPHLEKFEIRDTPPDDPHIQEIMEIMEQILPGSTQGNGKKAKIEEIDFGKFDELTKKMDAMAEAKNEDARQQLRDAVKRAEGTGAEAKVREKVEAALREMDELPDLPRPSADELILNLKEQFQSVEETRDRMRATGTPEVQLPEVDIGLEEIERKMRQAFIEMKEMYRTGAHYIDGKPPHKEPMDIVQYRFQKAFDKGEALAGRDLAGVDLSGLDLSGMDLSGCYLEYANLSNAKLKGANLQGAIVTHAKLDNADLSESDLRKVNFGDSRLDGANFSRARMKDVELGKADMSGARIIDCDLEDVNFLDAKMVAVDLSGSNITNGNFLNMDMSGGRFVGSRMMDCNFLQCTLENCDFSSADLTGSNFVECKMDRSCFVECRLYNVRFPGGCSLTGCNFDKANLDKANLRDVEAENCRFEGSSFNQADFSGANLKYGRFYGAVGKRAMFMKSDLGSADFSSVNLMEGSMMKARLTNADLRYSNFYAVEFMNATVGGTDFHGANLDLTKLEHWSPSK